MPRRYHEEPRSAEGPLACALRLVPPYDGRTRIADGEEYAAKSQ